MTTEQEIQLSDDLRHLVAGHSFQADPDALLQRAQRARRKNLATRGVAGIGVLAVAAAGTVIGLNAGGGSGAPEVRNAAYVVQQVSAALRNDANYVYRITDASQGTVWYQDQVTMNQYWVDGSGDTRIVAWDSTPVIDHYVHNTNTTVNYGNHTYSTFDQKSGGYVAGALPQETGFVDRIKQGLSSGQEKILGTGQYQGHQVIKLGHVDDPSHFELWVDANTYQPVHSVTSGPDGRDEQDLAFLPRTPDLRNTMNNPRVPAGFTKVDDASGGIGHGG